MWLTGLRVDHAGKGGPGLAWLHMVCGLRLVGCAVKFSEMALEMVYVSQIDIQIVANSSSGLSPGASMPTARSLKPYNTSGIVLSDETALLGPGPPVQKSFINILIGHTFQIHELSWQKKCAHLYRL